MIPMLAHPSCLSQRNQRFQPSGIPAPVGVPSEVFQMIAAVPLRAFSQREGRGRHPEQGFDRGFARRLPVVGNEQTLLLGPAAHWLIGPSLEYSKEPPVPMR
ncbi:hypothetical protein [Nonomuraea sp. B5E05]|uniref:hypothetical protein n=1 Tax=Nonomuraea sp. B5E05 TaxID=3153569 RepID=UPI003260C578